MEHLIELGTFIAKALVITLAFASTILMIAYVAANSRRKRSGLEIERLNERYRSFRRHLQHHTITKKKFKVLAKAERKERKKEEPKENRLFVVHFNGDLRASSVASLREEITAILSIAKPEDEVVAVIESGGGLVTSYGLAASQLERIKLRKVRLTVCVDKIAASGGYMMACVADKICAAPFAVLGSIGVVAQIPNFNKVLKKHDVEFREITAGEYKRTVTVFGEITEQGLQKFKSQIEDTHTLFKNFVARHRPNLDIAKVATGEYWFGTTALELGLCDLITTSDDYLLERADSHEILCVKYHGRRRLSERLSEGVSAMVRSLAWRLASDAEESKYGV